MTRRPFAGALSASPDLYGADDRARAADGPDFLCVGLQKAGTQWLYDQLQLHPDFWMPPFKELHYFDRTFPSGKIAQATARFLSDPERAARLRASRGLKPLDQRDARFFKKVAACAGNGADIDAYADLFADKGDLLTGDVTPGYSALADPDIARIAGRFEAAKAILLLRDPVERVWSQWRMSLGTPGLPQALEQDAAAFAAFLDRKAVVRRSYPTRIAAAWQARFGPRFRCFFLDDIAGRPEAARSEILTFLGADPAKGSGVDAGFNRKAKPEAPPRPAAIQALLRERFAGERARCAEAFGGPARGWPDAPY